MPIQRSDETTDTLGPILWYLWKHKWWVVATFVIVLVSGYLIMRMVPEQFKASAELYVSQIFIKEQDPPHPVAVSRLLESDDILNLVRQDYSEKYGKKPVFERFVQQFRAKTEVLQDTAVKKQISPIVVLEVQSEGREQTQFLIDSWIKHFISRFGNYKLEESVHKYRQLAQKDVQLEAEIQQSEKEAAQLKSKLAYQQKLLAQHMDMLAPAELRRPIYTEQRLGRDFNNVQVVMDETPAKQPGLISRLAELQLQLSQEESLSSESTTTSQLRSQVAAVDAVIKKTEKTIASLQTTVAEIQTSLTSVSRTIQLKSEQQRVLHEYLDVYQVAAGFAQIDVVDGRPVAGDIRALTTAVTPELRAWPPRTIVAGFAALCASVIMVIFLIFKRYIELLGKRQGA